MLYWYTSRVMDYCEIGPALGLTFILFLIELHCIVIGFFSSNPISEQFFQLFFKCCASKSGSEATFVNENFHRYVIRTLIRSFFFCYCRSSEHHASEHFAWEYEQSSEYIQQLGPKCVKLKCSLPGNDPIKHFQTMHISTTCLQLLELSIFRITSVVSIQVSFSLS